MGPTPSCQTELSARPRAVRELTRLSEGLGPTRADLEEKFVCFTRTHRGSKALLDLRPEAKALLEELPVLIVSTRDGRGGSPPYYLL